MNNDIREKDLSVLKEILRRRDEAEYASCRIEEIQLECIDEAENQIKIEDFDTKHAERAKELKKCELEELSKTFGKNKNKRGLIIFGAAVLCIIACVVVPQLATAFIPIAIIGGLIIRITGSSSKRKNKNAQEELEKKYDAIIRDAEAEDEKAREDYHNAVEKQTEKNEEKRKKEIDEMMRIVNKWNEDFDKIDCLKTEDFDDLELLIETLKCKDAYSIAEARKFVREEKARKEREEDARKAEEDARKAKEPGKLHLQVVRKDSSGFRSIKHSVFIDGREYGHANLPYNEYYLDPGAHNIKIEYEAYDSIYTSPSSGLLVKGASIVCYRYIIDTYHDKVELKELKNDSEFRF